MAPVDFLKNEKCLSPFSSLEFQKVKFNSICKWPWSLTIGQLRLFRFKVEGNCVEVGRSGKSHVATWSKSRWHYLLAAALFSKLKLPFISVPPLINC